MVERRKIFVGSSSEAQDLAESVGKVIERAGMEPVLWKDIFPAGDILLERIEQLPGMVDGAVLVSSVAIPAAIVALAFNLYRNWSSKRKAARTR